MYARRGAQRVTVKKSHAATRDRYTILTWLTSWPDPAGAPPVGVLFKASSGERIRAGLAVPDWMLLQFQRKGFFRVQDVIDALQ